MKLDDFGFVLLSSVNVGTVTRTIDFDDFFCIVDLIKDAIISLPDTIAFLIGKFNASIRPWIICKTFHFYPKLVANVGGNPSKFSFYTFVNTEVVHREP